MYVTGDDGQRLKTKIVATVGPYRDGIVDLESKPLEFAKDPKAFWPAFLRKFNHDCGYMIDVIRLNMSYFEKKKKEKRKTKPEKKKEENERNVIKWLRENTDITRHVALLGDLPGPKLRLHDVGDDAELNRGQPFSFLFRNRREDGHPCICLHEQAVGDIDTEIAQKLRRSLLRGRVVILSVGDGTPTLRVSRVKGDKLICIAEDAGPISNRQGVTIRGVDLDLPSFTTADEEALDFLIDNGLDWTRDRKTVTRLRSVLSFVAVSFVKKQDDILNVKKYAEDAVYKKLVRATRGSGGAKREEILRRDARLLSPAIIAKIETKQAWTNIDEILDAADGAMVARGDLALQIGARRVPGVQKHLIRLCNARGKPVITATEMLASMENNPEPTRAEANDVFNAVLDGSDALMLSGETSKGKYPYHAVKAMCDIALAAERHFASFGATDTIDQEKVRQLNEQRIESFLVSAEELVRPVKARLDEAVLKTMHADDKWREAFFRDKARKERAQETVDRVSMSACILANARDAYRAIVALTTSGRTARMISRFRPEVIIIGGAHDWVNARQLMLSFGVYPVNCGEVSPRTREKYDNPEEAARECCRLAKAEGLLQDGDMIILSAGTPLFCPGSANLVQIIDVD